MIDQEVIKFIFKKRTEFTEWDTYKEKIDFLDDFSFQQSVREKNISLIDTFNFF